MTPRKAPLAQKARWDASWRPDILAARQRILGDRELDCSSRFRFHLQRVFANAHLQRIYDAAGRLSQLTYPSGLAVIFDRDPASGEVTVVRNAYGGNYASAIVHDPSGQVSSLTFGNGRTLVQGWNLRGEPLSVQSGPLWLGYVPTPAGDVGAVTDRSEDLGCVREVTRSFRYDFLDRMAGRSDAAASGAGVCPAESLGPWAAAYQYVAGTDRVASRWEPDLTGKKTHAFGYDGEGNVSAIGRYDAAGASIAAAVCLRHDPLGRLTLVGTTGTSVTPGGTACTSDAEVTAALARYRYDGRQRRVSREVGAEWTAVVADAWGNPLSELTRSGTSWTRMRDYVWLDGQLLAQVEYDGGAGRTYYTHLDHLGTPRALTNQAGELVWSTFQRPYGEVGEKIIPDPLSGKTVVTNLRLPGQYDERLLGSVGLQGPYYNWNRWYLPGVGRYLELDPIALRGYFNAPHRSEWLTYAQANPLSRADPLGHPSIPPAILKLLADGGVPDWIVDLIVEWTYGTAGGAVCAANACRHKAVRDYFEAYGDCLKIILEDFKLPAAGINPSDQFVAPCAGKCRDITNSAEFKKKCLSCK